MRLRSPIAMLVISTCLWGGNFVAGRGLVGHIPPFTLAWIRWIIALLFVLPLFGREAWRDRTQYMRRWKTVLFLTITGVVSFNTLVYVSVQYTTSINAALMNAFTPIVILLLSFVFLREKIRWLGVVGILISVCGCLWIISHGSWEALIGLQFNRGDLWMVLAVALWGVYSVAVKKTSGTFAPNGLFAVTVVLAVLILTVPAGIEWGMGTRAHDVTWIDIAGVAYIGIFASIVAFTCWNMAVAELGPSRCAGYLNLIPVFSAVFATWFAGERLHAFHIVGALLVIGGVMLASGKLRGLTRERTFQ